MTRRPCRQGPSDTDDQRTDGDEHPILETFQSEDAVEHPGKPEESPDPADDSDAPAP